MGRREWKTKLSQDPKASECSSINPRVSRETLTEDGREEDESRAREREAESGQNNVVPKEA